MLQLDLCNPEATLTDEEITQWMNKVTKGLENELCQQ